MKDAERPQSFILFCCREMNRVDRRTDNSVRPNSNTDPDGQNCPPYHSSHHAAFFTGAGSIGCDSFARPNSARAFSICALSSSSFAISSSWRESSRSTSSRGVAGGVAMQKNPAAPDIAGSDVWGAERATAAFAAALP